MILPHRPLISLPVSSIRRIVLDPNNTPHTCFLAQGNSQKGGVGSHGVMKNANGKHEMHTVMYVPVCVCVSTHIVTVTQNMPQQDYDYNNMLYIVQYNKTLIKLHCICVLHCIACFSSC